MAFKWQNKFRIVNLCELHRENRSSIRDITISDHGLYSESEWQWNAHVNAILSELRSLCDRFSVFYLKWRITKQRFSSHWFLFISTVSFLVEFYDEFTAWETRLNHMHVWIAGCIYIILSSDEVQEQFCETNRPRTMNIIVLIMDVYDCLNKGYYQLNIFLNISNKNEIYSCCCLWLVIERYSSMSGLMQAESAGKTLLPLSIAIYLLV